MKNKIGSIPLLTPPKFKAILFYFIVLVFSFTTSPLSFAGRETHGGDPKIMEAKALQELIEVFLKKDLIGLIQLVTPNHIFNSEVKFQFQQMLKKGLLKDIENSTYSIQEQCLDHLGVAKGATAIEGDIGGTICFSLKYLMKEGITHSQLVGLAFHEHAHHFHIKDEQHMLANIFSDLFRHSNLGRAKRVDLGQKVFELKKQNIVLMTLTDKVSEDRLTKSQEVEEYCKYIKNHGLILKKDPFNQALCLDSHPTSLIQLVGSRVKGKIFFKDHQGNLKAVVRRVAAPVDHCQIEYSRIIKRPSLKCQGYKIIDDDNDEDEILEQKLAVKGWLYEGFVLAKKFRDLERGLTSMVFSIEELENDLDDDENNGPLTNLSLEEKRPLLLNSPVDGKKMMCFPY